MELHCLSIVANLCDKVSQDGEPKQTAASCLVPFTRGGLRQEYGAACKKKGDSVMQMKRGIIQSFSPATYTASVLLFEATSSFLTGVPVANTVDSTSGLAGALCA